ARVMVFFMVIYTFVKDFTSKVKVVTNAEAVSLMNNEDAVVVDLRSIDEFERGHIINSLNILPAEIKKNNVGKIHHHKDTPVILACATGMSAGASAELLSCLLYNLEPTRHLRISYAVFCLKKKKQRCRQLIRQLFLRIPSSFNFLHDQV
ncbi:rhodanese-like domain-containing protein, partial [Streptococcus suis]